MPKTEPAVEVRLQSIQDLIRERKALAVESGQCGVLAYAYGGCDAMLVGEALALALDSPEETVDAICSEIDGFELTEEQFNEVVKYYFLRHGIYKSFMAKAQG